MRNKYKKQFERRMALVNACSLHPYDSTGTGNTCKASLLCGSPSLAGSTLALFEAYGVRHPHYTTSVSDDGMWLAKTKGDDKLSQRAIDVFGGRWCNFDCVRVFALVGAPRLSPQLRVRAMELRQRILDRPR